MKDANIHSLKDLFAHMIKNNIIKEEFELYWSQCDIITYKNDTSELIIKLGIGLRTYFEATLITRGYEHKEPKQSHEEDSTINHFLSLSEWGIASIEKKLKEEPLDA